jgi:hypothetical protein
VASVAGRDEISALTATLRADARHDACSQRSRRLPSRSEATTNETVFETVRAAVGSERRCS